MTEIKAKVVKISLEKHPNADTLSIAKIFDTGWQVIVRTADFKQDDIAIYFPIDSQVDVTRKEFVFLVNKANSDGKFRVKTIKLRGELSQGLLIPVPPDVVAGLDDDFTDFYGVERYEPPVPANLRGDMVKSLNTFEKYISIENVKNYQRILIEGEQIRVTEKLHGTNARFGFACDDDGVLKYFVGSHNVAKYPKGNTEYAIIARNLDLENKLKDIIESEHINITKNFIIYGEIVGDKIQHLHYGCGKNERKLILFDVMVNGVYQSWEYVKHVGGLLGIDTVPVLYRGPYSNAEVLKFRDGPTTIGGTHIREGVVVTAEPERIRDRFGRVILKYISDEYLLSANKPGATDGH